MMRKLRRLISAQRLGRLLLVVYVLLAGLYSVATPLYEAPDEPGHFDYILQLRTTGRLPLQRAGYLGQAHQPPLYYVIGALVSLPADITREDGMFKPNPKFMWVRPGGNGLNASLHVTADTFPYTGQALAVHLVRAASVLMGAVTIGLALAIGRRLLPDRPDLYLVGVALLAVNPQFLFISGAISNDNLLTLAATGIWWQTLRTLDRPEQRRQWLYLGVWIAAAALAKFNGLTFGALSGLFLLMMLARRRAWRALMVGGLMTSAVVMALSGWWFVRNQVLYGDPLGWQVYQTIGYRDVRGAPLALTDPRGFFTAQIGTFDDFLRSFVGRFGWLNVKMPRWFYDGARLCLAAALAGWLVTAGVTIRRRALQIQRPVLMLIGLVVVGQLIFLMNVIAMCAGGCSQGRYLFPIAAPLMLLIGIGLLGWLPRRATPWIGAGLVGLMTVVAVWTPLAVIAPAYPSSALPKTALWSLPHHTDFVFGQRLTLRGYEGDCNRTQHQARLKLYWQAVQHIDFDYSVFVHSTDANGRLFRQMDGAPGEAQSFPPSRWWPGDIVADERTIDLPDDRCQVLVGVYNWQTGQRLAVTENDQALGDVIPIDLAAQR
jgi:4-amino-4-deoxy-L-arabinose transferase-like glycosyltransferase